MNSWQRGLEKGKNVLAVADIKIRSRKDIKNMEIERKKIENFVNGKNIPVCSFCGNNSWNISSKIFQLLEFDTNGLTLGGPTYPVVPITCSHCGNTLLINALVANLIDPPELNSPEKEG